MTDAHPPAPAPQPEQPPAVEHEDRDINLRAVLGFGGALFVIGVAAQLLLAWFFVSLLHREDREKRSQFPLAAPEERQKMPQTTFGSQVRGELPEGPRLEGLNLAGPRQHVGPERGEERAAERLARDEAELNGHGTPENPHIPIDEAMRLVAGQYKPKGDQRPAVRYDAGIPGTGGGSNSGRDIPEGRR